MFRRKKEEMEVKICIKLNPFTFYEFENFLKKIHELSRKYPYTKFCIEVS